MEKSSKDGEQSDTPLVFGSAATPNFIHVAYKGSASGAPFEQWLEEVNRGFCRLDVEPNGTEVFDCQSDFLSLSNIVLARPVGTSVRWKRTKPILADGKDDFMLASVVRGPIDVEHRNRSFALSQGQMCLLEMKSITAYKDLQFAPLGEGSPVEAALLWGDPAKGPAAVLVRMPKGYSEPWHSHSSTYRAVLIQGQVQSRGKNAATDFAEAYGPGSYLVQPGGQTHSEVSAGEGPLLALVFFEGPVDFVPV